MSKQRECEVVKVINASQGPKPIGIAAGMAALVGLLAGAGATSKFRRAPKASSEVQALDPSEQQGPKGSFDREAAGIEKGREGSPKGKIVAFAERKNWRWLGRLLQVQNRYGELNGNNLAAAVTLQTFLALFPLLIIAAAVAGFFVSNSGQDVPGKIIEALGITDPSAKATISEALNDAGSKKGWAAVIGFVTLLWSALGVSAALQYAYNQAWQASSRGIKDKAVGLGWMAGAAILFAASALITSLVHFLPAGLGIISVVLGIGVTFGLWIFTGLILPNVHVPWKAVVPGAIVGTVGLQAIQYLTGLLPGVVGGSSNGAYGIFGAVLGIIAALFIFGRIVVYSAVTNVVLYEGKYGTRKETIEMPKGTSPSGDGVARSGQTDK